MLCIVAKIKEDNNITGYRLLNTENGVVKEVTKRMLMKTAGLVKINNFVVTSDTISERNNEDSKYPCVDTSGVLLSNNRIVIVTKNGSDYIVTDSTGVMRSVGFEQLDNCDRSKIANILSFKEFNPYKKVSLPVSPKVGTKKSDITVKPIDISLIPGIEDYGKVLASIMHDVTGEEIDSILRSSDLRPELDKIASELAKPYVPIEVAEPVADPVVTPEKPVTTVPVSSSQSGVIDNQGDIDDDTYKLDIINDPDGRVILKGIHPTSYSGGVVIPKGVTHIDKDAFLWAEAATYDIPDSVVYLGECAFANTRVLELELPPSIKAIPHGCFSKSTLYKINLENITSIGNNSFEGTKLVEVNLVAPIIQLGIGAFRSCRDLKVFNHPSTLRKIRESAFECCSSLEEFDFTGISEIETLAFYGTALHKVVINPEVTYVKSSTFSSPNLTEVDILEGAYKISDGSFVNIGGNPITYTVAVSVSNIGVNVFNKNDTVRCYHNSIAESTANISECNIEYLDGLIKPGSVTIAKAVGLGINIPDLISKMIDTIYSADDVDYEYCLPEEGLLNIELDSSFLGYLGLKSVEKPTDYEERPKFKVLLDHYHKSCLVEGFGLSNKLMKLKDTFSITNKLIYNDGVSRVYEFLFTDHKFESKKAKYIIAMTGNSVRYCCLNNRNTDIYCNTESSKDLSKLIKTLTPGDTIGYCCTIGGRKYDNIASKGTVKNKKGETLSMNIYQALFNCSITVKMDRNHMAMILPANGKVLKCASLGKAVWTNESDESYKTKYCVIEDIQDLADNTIFEYGENSPDRDDRLFQELNSLTESGVTQRILDYSVVGASDVSNYAKLRNHCIVKNMSSVEDLDLYGLGFLLGLPIVEERTFDWLDKSVGKTVVPAAKSEYTLSDGCKLYQYKTVKRVAMRNKLLTGGDRTIYVYEVCNQNDNRLKVMASMLDIDDLYETAMKMKLDSVSTRRVYTDTSKFDTVDLEDVILIAAAFVNTHDPNGSGNEKFSNIWLTVYKPNGLYYLSYIDKSSRHKVAVLLIQIGDFNVILDYIDCANTTSVSGFKELNNAGYTEVKKITNPSLFNSEGNYRQIRYGSVGASAKPPVWILEHDMLLRTRNLVIAGETSIARYLDTGVSPVLCHMFGLNKQGESLYDIPKFIATEAGQGEAHTKNVEIDFDELDLGMTELDEDFDTPDSLIDPNNPDPYGDLEIDDEEIDFGDSMTTDDIANDALRITKMLSGE